MDADDVKAPQEPKDLPGMMKQMMETMCCSGEFGPADICRRMVQAMGRRSNAEAQSAPASGAASDSSRRRVEDEVPRGCCGPQSPRTPKRL